MPQAALQQDKLRKSAQLVNIWQFGPVEGGRGTRKAAPPPLQHNTMCKVYSTVLGGGYAENYSLGAGQWITGGLRLDLPLYRGISKLHSGTSR